MVLPLRNRNAWVIYVLVSVTTVLLHAVDEAESRCELHRVNEMEDSPGRYNLRKRPGPACDTGEVKVQPSMQGQDESGHTQLSPERPKADPKGTNPETNGQKIPTPEEQLKEEPDHCIGTPVDRIGVVEPEFKKECDTVSQPIDPSASGNVPMEGDKNRAGFSSEVVAGSGGSTLDDQPEWTASEGTSRGNGSGSESTSIVSEENSERTADTENTTSADTGNTTSADTENTASADTKNKAFAGKAEPDERKATKQGTGSTRAKKKPKVQLPKVTRHSSFDTEQYRQGYPKKRDHPDWDRNLRFYRNELRCVPDNYLIEEIHKHWWGNYDLLEYCHTFIQWLFPIRERGMNFYAQELQLHEIKSIRGDKKAMDRLHRSYEMMLDFYGMRLKDRNSGIIERTDNYRDRFQNLNRSSHNYLRITRILKCLGEFGMEKYKSPFVRFCLQEAIVEKTLPNTLHSALVYWAEVIKDEQERKAIRQYAQQLVDEEN